MPGTPDPADDDEHALVLVVGSDPALFALLTEWLVPHGVRVASAARIGVDPACRLLLVDAPFPRAGGSEPMKKLASQHPGVPILALSSNFFPGVDGNHAVARSLGVACVLAKPVSRDTLVGTVLRLLETHA